MKSPEPLSRIVNKLGPLTQLMAEAKRLQSLKRLITPHVPPNLAAHIELSALRDDCLVFHATSAAWAAELRYRAPEILAALAAVPDFKTVRSIRVRATQASARKVPQRAKLAMSAEAAASIVAQAAGTTDQAVREALLRLARRGRK